MTDKDYDTLLRFDAVAQARSIVGEHHDGDEADWLALALQIEKSKKSEEEATRRDDTPFSCDTERYLRVAKELGFEIVQVREFTNDGKPEEAVLMFHKHTGTLLCWDTYNGQRNRASLYFNWLPKDRPTAHDIYGFSGSYKEVSPGSGKYIMVGDIDAREALRYNFNKMCELGTFITPWVEQPWLWLLTYQDTKNPDYNYEAINKERLSCLPAHIKTALGVNLEPAVSASCASGEKQAVS